MDIQNNYHIKSPVTIVANGDYPTNKTPLDILKKSNFIIACDGAADSLVKNNQFFDLVIGDLDSVSEDILNNNNIKKIKIEDQSENDLRKCIKFLLNNNIKKFNIIGCTGKREDHTIGNIFSILELNNDFKATIYTDNGIFNIIDTHTEISSKNGQQISLFTTDKTIKITTFGLKYNIKEECLSSLFYGTLNESIDDKINIKISHGKILIFQNHL